MGDSFISIPSPVRATRVQFQEEKNEYISSPWILRLDFDKDDDESTNNHLVDNPADEDTNNKKFIVLSQQVVWYHQRDVVRFKHETQVYARLLMKKESHLAQINGNNDDRPLWSTKMWQAYNGFYKATTLDQMNAVMDAARTGRQPMDALFLGLEKWALTEVRTLKTKQRKALVHGIVARQFQPHLCSERQLRSLSRQLSRSSRLFAAYVGCAVAVDEEAS